MNTTSTGSDFFSLQGCPPAIRAVGCALLAIFLSVLPVSATTVSYQQDVGGYTGTEDTFLQSDPTNAGTDNGASAFVGWDDDDPGGTGYDVFSLIRFGGIFGGGAGQVPLGSQITSATLYLTVFDVGDTGEVRNALVPWAESDTFNSFCGGTCDQGVEYGPLVATAPAGTATEVGVNVTTALQTWSDGTTNNGWFIRAVEGGNGGVDVRSSEFGTTSARPRLVVVYDEGPPVVGNLTREPYLSTATSTSQTICWRSDVSSDSRVEYGLSSGSLTEPPVDDPAVVTDHCVNVTGLTPATQYWYNVGSTTAVQGGGTVDHYFWTHPVVGSATPFSFWAVGDGGNGTPDQVTVMNAMLGEAGTGGPDLAVYLGDIAYNSGTDAEFTNNYFAPYDPVIRNTVVWPAIGNHEAISTTSGECAPLPCTAGSTGPYYEAFVLPTNAEAGGVASGTEAYYSFDYGNVHFIALNSSNVSRSAVGPMAEWLTADISSTSQQWIVAFFHHPPYSKGTHNSDTEGNLVEMRENLVPILEAGGVDLVLTGHSHTYERSYLIDGTYSTPTPNFATLESNGNIVDDGDGKLTGDGPYLKSPGPNANEGAVYVVAGHGGQPVGGGHGHPVMYFAENVKGSCLIDVDANSMTLRNVRITGVVSDDFTIQKGDLPPRVTNVNPAKEAVLSTVTTIDVTFSTGVTGVDAADLTVNGSPATTVVPTGTDVYTFSGFTAPGNGAVSVVLAAGGIADEANALLLFTGDLWGYTIDNSPPAIASEIPARGSSIGILPSVTVNFTKPVFNVSAVDLLVNGSPAATLSGIDGTSGPYIFTGFAEPDQGLVTVDLLQNGIQDDQALLFAGDTWTYVLETRLVINEFLASNNTIIADENGGFDDYLEIYNPGNSTIDMSGMHLTNQLGDPTRYEIPAGVSIGPREYLLFWCNPSTEGTGPLHTNFNLDKDAITNEDIGLFDTAANGFAIIDGLTYTLQASDISSGRFPDATNGMVTMPPTPEATNTINCSVPADCSALTGTCTVGNCVGSVCVADPANEAGACEDGISCTSGETCSAGDCTGGASNCPAGEICNVTTDVCEAGSVEPLPIVIGDVFSYFKGTAEPSPGGGGVPTTDWAQISFNDSTWLTGANGFAYGTGAHEASDPDTNTILSDMQNAYASVYLRRAFHIDNPLAVDTMTLTVDFDDAFIAYVNGVEVLRTDNLTGVGDPPAYNQIANGGANVNHEGDVAEVFDLGGAISNLVTGTNVLAFQLHNITLNSSDAVLRPELTATFITPTCTGDIDCDDLQFCNGAETCDIGSGNCLPGTPPVCADAVPCTVDSCNETTDSCDNLPDDGFCDDSNVCTDNTCDIALGCQTANNTASCEDGNLCTENDICAGGACQTGSAVDCNDGVACTDDSCDAGFGCLNVDNCAVGEVCNLGTGVCDIVVGPQPGDIIISGFSPSGTPEWIELFNTTDQPISLENLNLLAQLDINAGDGVLDLEWQLSDLALDQTGLTIAPYSFFLVGETTTSPTADLDVGADGMNLATGEGGTTERAISLEVTVDAVPVHMDYVLYGRHDGSDTVAIPPGDLAFDGVTFPRFEVTRTVLGGASFVEGILQRISQDELHAGYAIEGYYTDETTLGSGYPNGVWTSSLHPGSTLAPRNSSSAAVPPPVVDCVDDNDCDDLEFCNGVETCDIGSGNCLAGTPPDCADAVACTVDSCNETTDSCENLPSDALCDDSNVCTDNTCDLALGCQTANNSNPCEDGDLCTENDICVAGTCQTGSSVDCDDSISCTDDSCDSGTGCINTDNCTGGDTCNLGTGLCESAPTVVTFQDGVSGYTGTQDALLMGAQAALTHGTLADTCPGTASGPCDNFEWDGEDPAPNVNYGVVRFDNIVGAGAGQVPAGATVTSATLTIVAYDPSVAPPADVHAVLVDWDETTVTTDNFGGSPGVQVGEYGPDIADGPIAIGTAVITITTAVQDWVDNPASNFGVIFVPNSPNGVVVRSSEYATVAERPLLTVTYELAACTVDGDCDDLQFCNGVETCDIGSGTCLAGTPPDCTDAVACTVDSCNETTDSCENVPNDGLCDDSNVCTDNTCDIALGCQTANNTASCEDGNLCTENDVCAGGACQTGSAVDCSDGIACTDDSCDSGVGCLNVDNCPAGETCNLTSDTCESAPAWTAYNDLSWYTGQLAANITTITSPANEAALPSSGELVDYATGTGTGVTLTVTGGDHLASIQGIEATTGDAFDIFNGIVSTLGVISYVNQPSPAGDVVLELTGLLPGSAYEVVLHGERDNYLWDRASLVTISDVDAFTNESSVATDNPTGIGGTLFDGPTDPSTRLPSQNPNGYVARFTNVQAGSDGDLTLTVSPNGLDNRGKYVSALMVRAPVSSCTVDADCDDLQFCNGAETCDIGSGNCLAGTPPDCADAVACTVDSCNEGTDACDNTPDDGACDDGNVCTDDTCDLVADCQNVPNTAACEEGDLCTAPDVCAGGGCVAGLPVDCDDSVDCTDDSCDSGTGCVNTDNCTGGTVCNLTLGICEAGPSAPDLPIIIGDDWRYFRGTVEPTPGADLRAWTEMLFDDSGWEGPAPSGFGYGADCASLHGTVLDATNPPAMNPNYVSLYIRHLFNIDNPAAVTALELVMDYDDGWVAYINGSEVARSAGMGGTPGVPPTFDQTTATGDHECSLAGVPNAPDVVDISAAISLLTPGANVLAIQGHNRSSTSSDFSLIPSMSATIEPPCTVDGDCDDGEDCTDDTCNVGTGECVFTPNDLNACDDAEACTDDACVAGACISTPNDANACTDSVACTDDSCSTGTCVSADNCTGGQVCNVGTGICETPVSLQPGDVIVSGFQPSGADEWIELFNTTTSAIALDNLELIVRLDATTPTPLGVVDIDWQLPAGSLAGATIAPQGFFLLREGAGPPAGDFGGAATLDFATGEGGAQAISVEIVIDGAHMDYLVYGWNAAEPGGTADVPPGDLPFDGVTFPRTEVIRSCAPLSAGQCSASPPNYSEGAVRRVTDTALYAGYDVEGYFTDETALGSGFPDGVWTSDHTTTAVSDPRYSGSPTVPPPTGTPCTLDSECTDNDVCNGVETCNLGTGFCQNGTPPVCDDANVCTDDSCDPIAGCETTNNTDPCDDLDACTSGDVCGAGVCLGLPISCDDTVSCTDDSCDTLLGCLNVDNCPAGQACNTGTDTCEAGPTIVSFQEGVGGYTGTEDTFIQQAVGAAVNGASEVIEWDLSDGTPAGPNSLLIQFGNLFGNGAGQIPVGATIVSATLEYTVGGPGDATGEPSTVHELLVAWDESISYDTLGGDPGATAGDEYDATVVDNGLGATLGTQSVNVTSSLQDWSDGLTPNNGWIFVAEGGGTGNGVEVRSSEYVATPTERPRLIVEYSGTGAQAQMTCALSTPTVPPGGSVDLETFLEDLGGLPGVRGYQTQIQIALTSGSGSASVPCPGGVFIDEARSDYLFFNETDVSWASTCSLQRASASKMSGSVAVGASPVYLSEYTVEVAAGTTAGTTFDISFVASPGSRLADENSQELPVAFGPVCTLTVQGCGLDAECDDGNLCTTDTCNAGTCENVPLDCSGSSDQCNDGVCNPGTGLCETQPANEGLTCDDLDACTIGDVCTGGVCSGPPMICSDATACTNDACVAGICVYSPSGVCSLEGDIFYYRDNTAGGFEPSAKGVPNVDIDVDQDIVADATSISGGAYVLAAAGSPVLVETMDKFGVTTISDENGSITSFDASFIAQHAVGIGTPLSANQLVAGDVSGNGSVTSFDAAQVAQFAADLLPGDHFQVAFDSGSDWAFFRCDNYVDAFNQDCGPPSYLHDPLMVSALDDDFHAVLYGDVTGNWQPATDGSAAIRVDPADELVLRPAEREAAVRQQDQALGEELRNVEWSDRVALLEQMPNGTLLSSVELELVPTKREVVDGVRRQTYLVEMRHGDGIQGLDLEIRYASGQVRVLEVKTGDAATDFNLLSNGVPGAYKIALYGVLPLQGTGTLLELTVEIPLGTGKVEQFEVSALANERSIPVRVAKGKRALEPVTPRRLTVE